MTVKMHKAAAAALSETESDTGWLPRDCIALMLSHNLPIAPACSRPDDLEHKNIVAYLSDAPLTFNPIRTHQTQ